MAILKIARMGHPVLRHAAKPVEDPTAPQIQALIRNMAETMQDANGAGLAAPQVHVPLRVVMFHMPENRADDAGEAAPQPLTVLINPEIEPLTADTELGWEGCLSVPGLVGAVPRFTKIRYGGLAPDGSRIEREAEGFHARVVQHECDHLDGMLYPQRMTDLSLLLFHEELKHGVPEAMQGVEEPEAEAV
ncbi:MAG: peptide deformylase [Alphaproteobacteria bacterium]|nr:peptide deformylase [Alphaproteobacteria bacterium]